MSTMIMPRIDNEIRPIQEWIPIEYNMMNAQPGNYDIVCSSMGMKQWTIIIEESL